MEFLNRLCPICSSDSKPHGFYSEPFYWKYGVNKDLKVPNWLCINCDLQFFSTVKNINDNATSLYGGLTLSPAEFVSRHYCLAKTIQDIFPEGCEIVDIGGGNHDISELLPDNYVCKIFDLFSLEDCNHKRIYFDLSDRNSTNSFDFPSVKADIVVLDNVLEHLTHFDCVKESLIQLKPQFVYVSVPNRRSVKYSFNKKSFYRPIEHVNSFSPRSIEILMKKISYERVHLNKAPNSFKKLFDLNYQMTMSGFTALGIYHLFKLH